jgi:hypothetical protein
MLEPGVGGDTVLVAEGGSGVAFGLVAVLVELGEGGVVGEDWFVGGL